ncbi:hypothetical protein ACO0RG_003277 [Hanseniaspora osmophila]
MDASKFPTAPKYSRIDFLCQNYQGFRPYKAVFLPKDYPDLTGKTAVITGMNTGIGYHVTKLLLAQNCEVYGLVRTASKGEEAKARILKELGTEEKGSLTIVGGCELSDFAKVKEVGLKLQNELLKDKTINIIIHNAGLMSALNNTSNEKEGIELMFATDVMGPQLLQNYLDPLFLKKDSDLKRIVWVSSLAHQNAPWPYGINFEDPFYKNLSNRPSSYTLYGQSKACNILQAKAWATQNNASKYGIISTSCFPGIITTDLMRDYPSGMQKISKMFFSAPVYGAYSELFAALSPTIKRQAEYVLPFGKIGKPRADIAAAMENGIDVQFWEFIQESLKEYL